MSDINKKTFWWVITGLVILRFLLVFLFISNIPYTDMQSAEFRPNFGGSYWPDEWNYFNLGQSFSKFSPIQNVANIGYPIFLAPIIYLAGAVEPVGIAKAVFIIQAFLFFGIAIILVGLICFEILKNRRQAIGAAALFTVYPYILFFVLKTANFPRAIPAFHYQMWINIGADYLSAILIYFGFYLFIKKYNSGGLNLLIASTIGAVIAAAALTRVANILYLPLIFLILILIKKYRESAGFGITAFLVYLPQWIYNFCFFGSPSTYGYRIKELSGHGMETKIFGNWFSFENAAVFFEKIWQNFPAFIFFLPLAIFILSAGFWRMYKENKLLASVILSWVLINIVFYLFFVAASSQLRYFIPSIPPLIILSFKGISEIYEYFRKI